MFKKPYVLFYILSFTWGIIMTLIGLLVLAFCTIFFKDTKVELSNGRIFIRFLNKSFGGVSLGIVILTDRFYSLNHGVDGHELGHTLQNAWLGPLFIPLIAIPSLIRASMFNWLATRYYERRGNGDVLKYDSAWFEGWATNLGNKHFDTPKR